MTMRIYLVGGAVRDTLLGKEPKDKDYVVVGATSADIEKMTAAGYKQVGESFPVFLHPTSGEEYAFARIERKTGPGYHGFEFETSGVTLDQDLSRRDLTINSMAMDLETGEIIDPYGGREDLKNKIIRHTTEAFAEDPLRVFRAARFAARYGFDEHPSTVELMRKLVDDGEIQHLSKERIVKEMLQIVACEHPYEGFKVLAEVGALSSFSEMFGEMYRVSKEAFQILLFPNIEMPEDKMGILFGFCAASLVSVPDDKQFAKQLHAIGLPLRTIKTANLFKNFGLMDESHVCSEERILEMLKRLEFTQKTEWNSMYRSVCMKFAGILKGTSVGYFWGMFNQFDRYVEEIAKIDKAAIAERLKNQGGRVIAEWIKLEEIDAIKRVDEIDLLKIIKR